MFAVKRRDDDIRVYLVYSVQRHDVDTAFMIWRDDGWLWVDAYDYIPVCEVI